MTKYGNGPLGRILVFKEGKQTLPHNASNYENEGSSRLLKTSFCSKRSEINQWNLISHAQVEITIEYSNEIKLKATNTLHFVNGIFCILQI